MGQTAASALPAGDYTASRQMAAMGHINERRRNEKRSQGLLLTARALHERLAGLAMCGAGRGNRTLN
ncbi:MAG TPA: hypothetical protein DCE25_10465 [Pseudomonas sp.]|nr:hypothetical protein [Pseudomonas sp.]